VVTAEPARKTFATLEEIAADPELGPKFDELCGALAVALAGVWRRREQERTDAEMSDRAK
jgi:MYXO-CTERM domain-containing protein